MDGRKISPFYRTSGPLPKKERAGKRMDGQMDRVTDGWADGRTNKWTDKASYRVADSRLERWRYGGRASRMERRMDGHTDRRNAGGQMERKKVVYKVATEKKERKRERKNKKERKRQTDRQTESEREQQRR